MTKPFPRRPARVRDRRRAAQLRRARRRRCTCRSRRFRGASRTSKSGWACASSTAPRAACELTLLGQRFLGEVGGLVAEVDRSVVSLRDAAQLESGDVTVGCVFSAVHHFLPSVIRTFRARHPRVLVRIIEEGADEVLASVKQGEADFAPELHRHAGSRGRVHAAAEGALRARGAGRPSARAPALGTLGRTSRTIRRRASRTRAATGSSSTRPSPTCRRCRARLRGAPRLDADRPGGERVRRRGRAEARVADRPAAWSACGWSSPPSAAPSASSGAAAAACRLRPRRSRAS